MLVWCEMPNWVRFDVAAARMGRRMLARMVETMGHHPSIIAWTIINEDWGTDVRHSARDRRWLRTTTVWLKSIDPSRLVVDNSACETPHGPNFHLRTDFADFHAYRSMPDGRARWRAIVSDFARRPGWLWSPHGDAAPTADEALVLSEFGGWGLPRPTAVLTPAGDEPWWWSTGQTFRRPTGLHRRFQQQRLGRLWPDVDALAEATQWRQFDGLATQIRELRRHASIKGYVVTELADAFWEANGLLDADRNPKAFHDRLAELNDPNVLIVDLPRTDLWGGERVSCDVVLSSFPDTGEATATAEGGGTLDWSIRIADSVLKGESARFERWPDHDAAMIGRLELNVPDVDMATAGELIVSAVGAVGQARAIHRQPIVVVPAAMRRSASPRRIRVVDPLDIWSIAERLASLGHDVVAGDGANIVVASHLDRDLLAAVDGGKTVILLARSTDAIPAGLGLRRSR